MPNTWCPTGYRKVRGNCVKNKTKARDPWAKPPDHFGLTLLHQMQREWAVRERQMEASAGTATYMKQNPLTATRTHAPRTPAALAPPKSKSTYRIKKRR